MSQKNLDLYTSLSLREVTCLRFREQSIWPALTNLSISSELIKKGSRTGQIRIPLPNWVP
jgi:hypothetical protein